MKLLVSILIATALPALAQTINGVPNQSVSANQVNGATVPASAPLLGTNSSNQVVSVTTLPTSAEPAHTGDMTNTAGSLATTVAKVNGSTPGGSCTNQVVTSLNSSAVPTCTSLATAYLPTAHITRTAAVSDLAPVTTDSGLILVINPPTAIALTRVYCASQGGTNVVINLDKRAEGTIGTDSGAHLLGSDLTAVNTGANTSTFSATPCGGTSSCAIAAHTPVVMTITSISGTVNALNCSIDYTVN